MSSSSATDQGPMGALTSKLGLLESGYFADAEVICGDKTWKVHRSELCVKSSYFRAAFTGNFSEAKGVKIHIEEQDPEMMGIALKHIYGAETNLATLAGGRPFLTFCVGVVRAADYLLLPDLQETAEKAIGGSLDTQLKILCTSPMQTPLLKGMR